ncbi:hypothetical protein HDU77_008252 [Chytriomyces hyalinus]|nr:hypothetical protein HDU77_008252 [Chytriomyces hyalinus]
MHLADPLWYFDEKRLSDASSPIEVLNLGVSAIVQGPATKEATYKETAPDISHAAIIDASEGWKHVPSTSDSKGNASSQQATTTVEFKRNESNGPVTVSMTPNMLRSLRGLAPEASVKGKQSLDDVVRAKVDRELELQKQRKLNYEKMNAEILLRDADDLLRRQKIAPLPAVKDEIIAKEKALVACYKSNSNRSLDCWKEVEDLKAAVLKAQRDFFVNASA